MNTGTNSQSTALEWPKVVLGPAYAWRCPDCGLQQFVHAEVLDLTSQEKRETIAQAEGIDVDEVVISEDTLEQLEITTSPTEVQCSNCSGIFKAEDFENVDLL